MTFIPCLVFENSVKYWAFNNSINKLYTEVRTYNALSITMDMFVVFYRLRTYVTEDH